MKNKTIIAGLCCMALFVSTGAQSAEDALPASAVEGFLVDTFAQAQQMKSRVYNCARIAYYGGLYVNGDAEGSRLLNASPYEDNPQLYAMFKQLVEKHNYQLGQFESMSGQCLARIGLDVDNPIQVAAQ